MGAGGLFGGQNIQRNDIPVQRALARYGRVPAHRIRNNDIFSFRPRVFARLPREQRVRKERIARVRCRQLRKGQI